MIVCELAWVIEVVDLEIVASSVKASEELIVLLLRVVLSLT